MCRLFLFERGNRKREDDIMDLKDRVRGCLFGGAVGDALGYPVEFLEDGTIFRIYGENGITQYPLCNGKALISDDTQMSLFTADGLLRAERSNAFPTPEDYVSCIYESYLSWLSTQDQSYVLPEGIERSELLQYRELHSYRSPGYTCLSALASGKCGSFDVKLNNSKGCGGVMRIAPVAVFLAQRRLSAEAVDLIAARAAAITHSHVLGYIPAAFLAHILVAIVRGYSLEESVSDARHTVSALFGKSDEIEAFLRLIDTAVALSRDGSICDDLDATRELGQGWVAEETVAIAVYCSLRHRDSFERAVVASVNHSGDSDSTGAVTGNIMGTLLGFGGIPQKYLTDLELYEVIRSLSDRLAVSPSAQ